MGRREEEEGSRGEERKERERDKVVLRFVCTKLTRDKGTKGSVLAQGLVRSLSLSLGLTLGFEVSAKDGDDGGVLEEDGRVQGSAAFA